MNDTVSRQYNQIIKSLGLDGYPMSNYNTLDIISLVVDLERVFNIQINNDKANELYKQGSHEAWMNYIRELL